jgi:hypothetical protein
LKCTDEYATMCHCFNGSSLTNLSTKGGLLDGRKKRNSQEKRKRNA